MQKCARSHLVPKFLVIPRKVAHGPHPMVQDGIGYGKLEGEQNDGVGGCQGLDCATDVATKSYVGSPEGAYV